MPAAFPTLTATDTQRWVIGGRLHASGSSNVLWAHERGDEHALVAIKVLQPRYADVVAAREQFAEETRKLLERSAQCAALPEVLGQGEAHWAGVDVPYVVMSYAEGRTLRSYIDEGRQELLHAVVVAAQLSEALMCMQARPKPFLHLDLHPDNILVPHDPQRSLLILDFGGDSALDGVWGAYPRNGRYLCPEQARREEPTPLWDVYPVGLMLHEMLSGALPNTTELPDGRQRVEVDPTLPDDLRVIIECATAPVDERCTAEEMHEALVYVHDLMTQESQEVSPTVNETTQPQSRLAQRSLAAQQFLENKAIATTLVARPADFAPTPEPDPAPAVTKSAKSAKSATEAPARKWQPMAIPDQGAERRAARDQRRAEAAAARAARREAAQQAKAEAQAAKAAEREAADRAKAEADAARAAEREAALKAKADIEAAKSAERIAAAKQKEADAAAKAADREAVKKAAEQAKAEAASAKAAEADAKASDSVDVAPLAAVAAGTAVAAAATTDVNVEQTPAQPEAVTEEVQAIEASTDVVEVREETAEVAELGDAQTVEDSEPGSDIETKDEAEVVKDTEMLPLWLVVLFMVIVITALVIAYLGYTGSLFGLIDSLGKVFK